MLLMPLLLLRVGYTPATTATTYYCYNGSDDELLLLLLLGDNDSAGRWRMWRQ